MSNVNIYQNYSDCQLTECTEFTSNNNNLRAITKLFFNLYRDFLNFLTGTFSWSNSLLSDNTFALVSDF